MRRIGVVTVARSDYGIYRPLLRRIERDPDLELALIVAGMHLTPAFGDTIEEIRADGFAIAATVDMTLAADAPGSIARSMGLGLVGFAQAFERIRPDIVVVLGDRFEMHAAATAAVPFLVPLAHIGGGALSRGAIDDGLRHSITKLSHVHLVETEPYRRRVIQMGEEPWRVHLTGALSLDNLNGMSFMSLDELNDRFGLALDPASPPLLVTFHPVTREYQRTRDYMESLLGALEASGRPIVFTHPSADTGGRVIIEMIEDYVRTRAGATSVPHLGTRAYFSLMRHAAAMVGNSSSGIIEAASLRLPVVNIGARQQDRLAPANVVHCPCERPAIAAALARATDPGFREGLEGLVNPYGDGRAAERMIEVLQGVDLADPRLIHKAFHDLGP